MGAKSPINNDVLAAVLLAEQAKKNNPKWLNFFRCFFDFLKRCLESMYHWDNLPETMDGRFIEKVLMEDGICGFYNSPMYGHVNTRATWGELGMYEMPVKSTFYSVNGILNDIVDVSLSSNNAVLCLNNPEGTGYCITAIHYAERLADIAISHGVNVDSQKTPIALEGTDYQLEQAMKAYQQYIAGSPVIPTKTLKMKTNTKASLSDMGETNMRVLNLAAPFVAPQLHAEFLNVLHEFFEMVGISFANNQKSERMLVDEVNANLQEVLVVALSGLTMRNDAATRYNNIHGTDIKVHLAVNPMVNRNYIETLQNRGVFGGSLDQIMEGGDPVVEESNSGGSNEG